jgi:hypothetical protein
MGWKLCQMGSIRLKMGGQDGERWDEMFGGGIDARWEAGLMKSAGIGRRRDRIATWQGKIQRT